MPKATHRVVDTNGSMIGYVIDQHFYADCYVKENIEVIENLSCGGRSHRIMEADELPELDYKSCIVRERYRRLCEENPFVRDIQVELSRWKNDSSHQVLQLEGFCRVFDREQSLMRLSLSGKSKPQEYEVLWQLYRIYIQIGGYPETVKKYKATGSVDACYGVISRLLDTFREESRNYFSSPREVEIFDIVYREAFREMCREKKGSGKNIIERVTSLVKANTDAIVSKSEISNAVVWLKYTGILGTCSLANEGDIRNMIPDRRIYYMDCGIASFIGMKYTMESSAFTGLLAETFVYNELHRLFKVPFDQRKVKEDEVCFSVFHSYELDFMLTDRENVVYGIEVKAKDGEPQSLRIFIDKKFIDRGILLKQIKGGRSDLFDTIPIFAAACRFPYEEGAEDETWGWLGKHTSDRGQGMQPGLCDGLKGL